MIVERHEFASDNVAPICPEAWAALQEANVDYAPSYGEDRWTARVCGRGPMADKIDIGQVEALLARHNELHSHKPGAISIAQATEFGTVYTCDEIAAIADLARTHRLFLHMDGARFANAIASLNCAPKAITWNAGVDVLCFGGTKNGVAVGELLIFFDKKISREFDYRAKQAGQLGSKMRFLAAPWLGLLTGDVWLWNAQHANRACTQPCEPFATGGRDRDRISSRGKRGVCVDG